MRRVSLLLWMAPSLEENTVFNEGERKLELPAASRNLSLFSFASFPLFTGMRDTGPIHPHCSPSLGLMRDAPRPLQAKMFLQTGTQMHNSHRTPQLWDNSPCSHPRAEAAGHGYRYGIPKSTPLQPHTPQELYTRNSVPLRRN